MSKIGVFTFRGPREGKTELLLDKYPFINGVFKTQSIYAVLMAPMLCGYYGCELTYEDSGHVESDELEDAEGSLVVSSTKGLTEGEKMLNQDLAAKFQHAQAQMKSEADMAEKRAEERAILDAKQVTGLEIFSPEIAKPEAE